MKRKMMMAAVCAAGMLAGAEAAAPGRQVTIMSLNIRIGYGLDADPRPVKKGNLLYLPQCAKLIREAKPDFVAIQEIDRNSDRVGQVDQTAELARLTGMQGTFVPKIPRAGGEYGLAILSKEKPLSVSKVLMPGVAHTRCLEILEFKEYYVACTHFPLKAEFRNWASEIVRVNLAGLGKPVFLAGDFNAAPDSKAIEILKQDFTILSDVTQPTFRSDRPKRCIDYIMVDTRHAGRFELVARKVVAAPEATDHCALIVTVRDKGK